MRVCTSIFVEMTAITLFSTYESEPFRTTTVFLFLSFAYFFLFLLRKKRKEMGIY